MTPVWGMFFRVIQDEDSEAVLAADFEIGHFIRERIVPRAVLYFTGEAIEDDDDDVSVDGTSSKRTLPLSQPEQIVSIKALTVFWAVGVRIWLETIKKPGKLTVG